MARRFIPQPSSEANRQALERLLERLPAATLGRVLMWVGGAGLLEPVSKPPKVSPADERAGEDEEGHMHDRVSFPADAQAAVVVQPREGPLDNPTPSP
jgi:hypothetical protein